MPDIHNNTNPQRAHSSGVVDNHALAAGGSAVSWAAILAGAAAAAALSLILVLLGTGFGFSAVSPWSMEGVSAAKVGFAAIIWLSLTQLAASGMGGYLAGRLRTRWASTHIDEVYFRDTAHGFLTWAVATLLTAALLTTAVGAIVGTAASAGSKAIGSAAGSMATLAANSSGADNGQENNTMAYFVDSMFRGGQGSGSANTEQGAPAAEVIRILMQAQRSGNLEQQDERYIAQLITQRTNLSQQDAERRVSTAFNQLQTTLEEAENTAREAADEARKATAYAALWMFITLLMGAFTASLMAVYGGRQRDA